MVYSLYPIILSLNIGSVVLDDLLARRNLPDGHAFKQVGVVRLVIYYLAVGRVRVVRRPASISEKNQSFPLLVVHAQIQDFLQLRSVDLAL